ncbi:MAG: hypothetical protein WC708_10185 [Lentisphaeria bacterium]
MPAPADHAVPAPPPRRSRWRRLALGAGLLVLCGLAVVAWELFRHAPFAIPRAAPAAPDTPVAWWEQPAPLTADEAAGLQWLAEVTCRLPEARRDEVWKVGGDQYGVYSIRYQAAFAGYAAAALGMRTPAYPGLTAAILRDTTGRLIDRRAWSYIQGYWGKKPWFPDPCRRENVMYSGHLLQLAALYEAASGDPCFRTAGFDLVWDGARRTHYTTLSLAEAIAAQIRANPGGGVTCEPGLVFFPCNNHPHVAFRLLEGMGLGNWAPERAKWEPWALATYQATAGGGAVRILYHAPTGASVPRGNNGLDGWSLLWYAPWAADPATPAALWPLVRDRIAWGEFGDTPCDRPMPLVHANCCRPVQVPPAPTASFLAAAARACGDPATAGRLEAWLDRHFARRQGGRFWLDTHPEWRVGTTANRLLALAQANGSDLRALALRPLPRDYFRGLLLDQVVPDTTPVFAAYRDGTGLVLELDAQGRAAVLGLRNAPARLAVSGLPAGSWHWDAAAGHLTLPPAHRLRLHLTPLPPDPTP